jgi:hypothetical protein
MGIALFRSVNVAGPSTRFPGIRPVSSEFLLRMILVVAALGGVLVLVAAVLHRRHRKHLARIAARCSMSLTTGPCPASLLEKAGQYRSQKRKVVLSDVIVELGESRNSFLARRRVGRRSHQLLYFELGNSSRLDGFCVLPESVSGSDQHEFSLQWRAPQSQWNDQRALSMAARVMYNLSHVGDRGKATPLGLEVKGRRVWIHSSRPLRGQDLDRFVDDATRLRQLLLKSLQRANELSRTSTRSRPIESLPASTSFFRRRSAEKILT